MRGSEKEPLPLQKRIFGKIGEQLAVTFLENKGYKIIKCNYRAFAGEIDIIAEICDVLVFVEVKTRSDNSFGKGYESVTRAKQKKILRTAQAYINRLAYTPLCRFDVISIDSGAITHIENAFTL
jgi:putative endonuclease